MVKGHIEKGSEYKFETVLEEVIGDKMPGNVKHMHSNMVSVHVGIVERAKEYSIKTELHNNKHNDMQVHFSFSDGTSIGLDF